LYWEEDFSLWDDMIHTFFELKTSHRFDKDPAWGKLLTWFRGVSPTIADVKKSTNASLDTENVIRNAIPQTPLSVD
jgi:hypothetical protein